MGFICVYIYIAYHTYFHLVYGRGQRQPSRCQRVEVDLHPLRMGLALLPQSQRVNQIPPGTPVTGGFWQVTSMEMGLEVDTRTIR